MRILYVARSLDNAGSRFVLEGIFPELRRRGHEIMLLNLERARRGNGQARAPGDNIAAATEPTPDPRPAKPRRIRKLLYSLAPGIKTFLYDSLRSFRPQRRAISDFRPDLIVSRHNWTTAVLASRQKTPCLMHYDGVFEAEAQHGMKARRGARLLVSLSRRITRSYGYHSAAVSAAVRDTLVGTGFRADDFTILHNGVDVDRFHPDVTPHRISEQLRGRTVVGFVGSFRPWHRVDDFLALLPALRARHPEVAFLLVGSGPEWHKVEKLAQSPELRSHVVLMGPVPHEEIPSVVACFDIGIIPFTNFACSPLKIYETMAMGKATVAPGFDTIKAIIDHDEDGMLFTPDDVSEMQSVLLRLLGNDELRDRIGASGRAKMVEKFTWKHCADRFEEACRRAVAKGSGKA